MPLSICAMTILCGQTLHIGRESTFSRFVCLAVTPSKLMVNRLALHRVNHLISGLCSIFVKGRIVGRCAVYFILLHCPCLHIKSSYSALSGLNRANPLPNRQQQKAKCLLLSLNGVWAGSFPCSSYCQFDEFILFCFASYE